MSSSGMKTPKLGLEKGELKPLYKTQPLKHAFHMVYNWAIIIATILLTLQYFNPATYLLAVIIIGARMHALAILMHDATHFRFLKNRKWNDGITNFFTMYPLFTSIEVYRANHLKHHNNLNSDHDPDWVAKLGKKEFIFPKSKREFIMTVLSYFLLVQGTSDAIWFLKRFNPKSDKNKKKKETKGKWVRLGFYLVLAIILSLTGTWLEFFIFWFVPYLSTFFMFQYIRSVAEHFGELEYEDALSSTRTVKAHPIEQFFLAPHNVGYHLEHHLYPGVPYYHLPRLHKILMKTELYANDAHITNGYVKGLLNELGHIERVPQAG